MTDPFLRQRIFRHSGETITIQIFNGEIRQTWLRLGDEIRDPVEGLIEDVLVSIEYSRNFKII